MQEPKRSRPFWPDVQAAAGSEGLKPWSWALERLESSHNYWIATSRPDGAPHLMIVWGIWWRNSFWFTTGPRTRKAKNLQATPQCVVGTESADQAVILEGRATEIEDSSEWTELARIYDAKYGGQIEPMLAAAGGSVFRVEPRVVFAQDEHAPNFVQSVTRWTF
jgi:general stress protein 26